MSTKQALKGIGKRLRDDAEKIVEAPLPERLAELLRKLRCAEENSSMQNSPSGAS